MWKLALIMIMATCAHVVDAHVRLLFTGYPIRNALNPSIDGQYSVSGPCGGVSSFGLQGVTPLTNGQTVSATIAYNGGHSDPANAFHAAIKCDVDSTQPFDDSVFRLASGTTLDASNALALSSGGFTVAATTSSTAGYELTFKLPTYTSAQLTNPKKCVISLLDQRNWGGCIDVTIAAAGSGAVKPGASVSTEDKTACQIYCDYMAANCQGIFDPFNSTSGLDCLTSCAAYPTDGADDDYSHDSIQCRQSHVEFVSQYGSPNIHCRHASPDGGNTCVQATGQDPAPNSPCTDYCNNMTLSCAGTYSSRNACMKACAIFRSNTTGAMESPPIGDNIECRSYYAQASHLSCSNAASSGGTKCKTANPLTTGADTLSATFVSQVPCDPTLPTCCCYWGNFTVVHQQGSASATGYATLFNPMAVNYTCFGPAATNLSLYRFDLSQPDPTNALLKGSVTLAGDPFDVVLVDNLLVVTNAVSGNTSPKICSMQGKFANRVDATTFNNQANTHSTSIMLILLIAIITLLLQ